MLGQENAPKQESVIHLHVKALGTDVSNLADLAEELRIRLVPVMSEANSSTDVKQPQMGHEGVPLAMDLHEINHMVVITITKLSEILMHLGV